MKNPTRIAGAIAGAAAFAGLAVLPLGVATQAGAQTHTTAQTSAVATHHTGYGCGYWDDCDDWGYGGWYDWGW